MGWRTAGGGRGVHFLSRIAILSDIHGNLRALDAVIADAQGRGCDVFLNLGDSLSGPLWPVETAERLMREDWPTIAGNHERQLLTLERARMGASDGHAHDVLDARHLAWIAAQPAVLAWSPEIFMCHGTPASDLEHFLHTVEPTGMRDAGDDEIAARAGERREAFLLCGHTHLPRAVVLADGRIVVDPGSVGLQAFDDDRPWPYRVEVGDPRARYAIIDNGAIEFVAVEYDHEAAAVKAAHEGRDDWAVALRTGRITA
ncbi:MAG: metallophosphoesterase family protein [Pseudomonadota bacterium]|uniref:metallophosphoesterase family protein n=1 Tax=Sphingomonas sp. ERG5 TaxID=1381597 RepID=UPI00068CADEB|nr:metallophosphoesterase family protein [Sphingomonas sp. ERG5]